MNHSMTDIHQHLFWGIDDGPQTHQVMQAMLRQASEQGIGTVVATPHCTPGLVPFDLGLCRERQAEAQCFGDKEGLDVKVLLGAEIAWTHQTVLSLRQSRIPTLGDTDYVLLEFWRNVSWQVAADAVRQLIGAGYCPVLAHPERYHAFMLSPKKALRFREQSGVLLQVNAASLLNPVSMLQRRFLRILLEQRAIDAVATDAHGCPERPINLLQARKWLAENTDETYAAAVINFDGIFTE